MSRYYSYSSYDSGLTWIYIVVLVVMLLMMPSCNNSHIASERAEANMVYIEEGYCYDADTKIIHKETIIDGGRSYDNPTYYPYVNENGNYCKYERGKWIELIKSS